MLKKNVSLTEDQEKICKLMGTPKEELMRALNYERVPDGSKDDPWIITNDLSKFDKLLCKYLGVTEEAFIIATLQTRFRELK